MTSFRPTYVCTLLVCCTPAPATAVAQVPPWDLRQELSTQEAGAHFGASLALGGEWLIVGLPYSDVAAPAALADAGGVMIYRRQPAGDFVAFTAEPLRSHPTPEAGARFGYSVALWGDRLLVGAPLHGPNSEGRVEFWEFDATAQAWGFRVGYTYTHPIGLFGFSVALNRDRAVIGEPSYEGDGSVPNSGRVHSFVRNAADTFYIPDQVLLPIAPVANGNFGFSVAVADFLPLQGLPDRLVVGEPNAGVNSAGLAWIYEIDAGDFAFAQVVAPAPGFDGSDFGRSVDLSGSWNVIGASDASQLHLVRRELGGSWTQPAPLEPPLPATRFGESVDLAGARLLVGQPPSGGLDFTARAHLYTLSEDGTTYEHALAMPPPVSDGEAWRGFGEVLALDGDGAAVAAPQDEVDAAIGAGRVALYFTGRVFRDGFELVL